MLPLAAVGFGGLVHALVSRTEPPRGRPGSSRRTPPSSSVATAIDTWVTRPDDLAPMRAETEAMLGRSRSPTSACCRSGAPQPLVLGQLRNPLQHQMFIGGLAEYLDETWPGGLEAMAAVVRREQPTFITMDHPTWYGWLRPLILRATTARSGPRSTSPGTSTASVGEEEITRLTRILDSGP